ncbi:hypothetical protein L7F22_052095 [Adiantum nelumboides]|nr:hypothetical protein [Adiantum nelumboides]
MKASVTFREEKSPLIRMKFPVTLAGFPLASGVVLGDNQDLALHLGTPPEAFPAVKVAYQPNLPASPLSLILKAGIGPWGPPRTAAVSLSAELRFSRAASGPFFTLHVKPRIGDFSLRKMVKLASFGALSDTPKVIEGGSNHSQICSKSRRQSYNGRHSSAEAPCTLPTSDEKSHPGIFDDAEAADKVMSGNSLGLFGDAPAVTPLQLDKSSLFTPMPYRGQPFNRMHDGVSEEAESVDNWGNDYVKIENFDKSDRRFQEDGLNFTTRSHDDKTSNLDDYKDHESHLGSPLSASAGSGSCVNEQETASMTKPVDFFPVPWCLGVDESIRGWSLHSFTSLPLGSQTALKFRWGVKAHRDFWQGWGSQLSSFKPPNLYLQKISLLTAGFTLESCKQGSFSCGGPLPTLPQYEDIHELSPVAALCGSMKRQLQLLYAENQVLKKAMEEMKSQFEQRNSGNPRRLAGNLEDVLAEEPATDFKLHGSNGKKEQLLKSQHEKGGSVSEKGKRSQGHNGLDALKKLGGLGRGGNGKSQHSMSN